MKVIENSLDMPPIVPKNFVQISREDQKKFLESFKYILSDIDGVIWDLWKPFPGASDCFKYLKETGKKIAFVTNNNMVSAETTRSHLNKNGFPYENVITPGSVIINYLKSAKFDKVILSLGSEALKQELVVAGFKVAKDPAWHVNDLYEFIEETKDDQDIGSVIFDGDMNLTRIKLQKAINCLKRPDCLFITGFYDDYLSIGFNNVIGNGHFYRTLRELTGRNGLQLAKPSREFAIWTMHKLAINNKNDVLFIGDSIESDMAFAANIGFKKLLVLSGKSKLDDLHNWKHPENFKPDYYVENLNEFKTVIQSVYF